MFDLSQQTLNDLSVVLMGLIIVAPIAIIVVPDGLQRRKDERRRRAALGARGPT